MFTLNTQVIVAKMAFEHFHEREGCTSALPEGQPREVTCWFYPNQMASLGAFGVTNGYGHPAAVHGLGDHDGEVRGPRPAGYPGLRPITMFRWPTQRTVAG